MKILVLGRNGQVALALAELAQHSRHQFEFASSEIIDLARPREVEEKLKKHNFDLLINAAAYTQVDRAETERDKANNINAVSVRKIAEVCKETGARLIHISSDYVYGGAGEQRLQENSETSPKNYYGLTKLEGEKQIAQVRPRFLVLRTSWVYSAWGVNFLKTMLKVGSEREELKIVSDQIGSPTYAPDLARAMLAVIDQWTKPEQDGVYNLAGKTICSWCDFADTIFSKARSLGFSLKVKNLVPIKTSDYETAAVRPLNSRLDQKKIFEEFKVELPNLEISVIDCLRRLQENA